MDDTIWSQPVLVVPFSGSVTGTATLRGSGWATGEDTCRGGGSVCGEELTGKVVGWCVGECVLVRAGVGASQAEEVRGVEGTVGGGSGAGAEGGVNRHFFFFFFFAGGDSGEGT